MKTTSTTELAAYLKRRDTEQAESFVDTFKEDTYNALDPVPRGTVLSRRVARTAEQEEKQVDDLERLRSFHEHDVWGGLR